MQLIHDLIALLRDPGPIIQWGGYPALALIIFLETGAMVAFLPGDSLLFVAGLYAAKGDLNIVVLNRPAAPRWPSRAMPRPTPSAPRSGRSIFNRPELALAQAGAHAGGHAFYEKHGGKAIIIARFVPLVRTFVPVVAGVAGMGYRQLRRCSTSPAASPGSRR